jgi:hypothetical protein
MCLREYGLTATTQWSNNWITAMGQLRVKQWNTKNQRTSDGEQRAGAAEAEKAKTYCMFHLFRFLRPFLYF